LTRPSNVIRLRPRQWLDTVEDLVPIGRAPADPKLSRLAPSAVEPPAAPWAASDFWGEDAAHLQDALHAPLPERGSDTRPADDPPRPDPPTPPDSPPSVSVRGRVPGETDHRHRLAWKRPASARLAPALSAMAIVASAAVLIAIMASSALDGAAAARRAQKGRAASHARSVRLIAPANEVRKLVGMMAPAKIPPLAGRPARATKAKSSKPRAAVGHATGTDASTAPSTYAAHTTQSRPPIRVIHSPPVLASPAGPSGRVSLLGAGTTPSG
jgi:hypothetical protein